MYEKLADAPADASARLWTFITHFTNNTTQRKCASKPHLMRIKIINCAIKVINKLITK